MKKGFTIVELLMVIAILAVLLGIVTTAATASIRQSRERQAKAMQNTLQNGLAAYRARKGEWPGKLEDWADRPSDKGTLGYLSNDDYNTVMHKLLSASSGKSSKSRVMDPVGLAVIPTSGADGKLDCMDFRTVTTKNNKHAKRMEPNEMTVVYPRTNDGKALRFVIEYNTESDEVTVMTQSEFQDKTGINRIQSGGGEVWR